MNDDRMDVDDDAPQQSEKQQVESLVDEILQQNASPDEEILARVQNLEEDNNVIPDDEVDLDNFTDGSQALSGYTSSVSVPSINAKANTRWKAAKAGDPSCSDDYYSGSSLVSPKGKGVPSGRVTVPSDHESWSDDYTHSLDQALGSLATEDPVAQTNMLTTDKSFFTQDKLKIFTEELTALPMLYRWHLCDYYQQPKEMTWETFKTTAKPSTNKSFNFDQEFPVGSNPA